MAGYSGTPLAKELGIKSGDKLYLIGAPNEYRDWIGALPEGAAYAAKAPNGGAPFVHLFVKSLGEFDRRLP